jgi:hypothetical protein
MIFQHSGIAYTRFVAEPVEHFVIHGFFEALQHCVMRAMLYSLMEKLRRIFNRMTLRGDTLILPCPPFQPEPAHPLDGTIRIAPEHLRQRDEYLASQARPSMGCAPVPHFTSMGGALMALQPGGRPPMPHLPAAAFRQSAPFATESTSPSLQIMMGSDPNAREVRIQHDIRIRPSGNEH